MSNYKKEFELETAYHQPAGSIRVIGQAPKDAPYVMIEQNFFEGLVFIKDKDLERFAVNILRALKSKRLK